VKPYYETLKVAETATQEDIKLAYRIQAKEFHPDKEGDPEIMSMINEAYSVLGDPEKRAYYDQYGTVDKTASTDEEAEIQVLQAFRSAIKMDRPVQSLFELVHSSIQGVLDDVMARKRGVEFDIDKAKHRKRTLIKLKGQKVKDGMDILKQAFDDEVSEIDATISRIDLKVFDREIEVLKKAKDIMDREYPKEKEPEGFPVSPDFFRIKPPSLGFRTKY